MSAVWGHGRTNGGYKTFTPSLIMALRFNTQMNKKQDSSSFAPLGNCAIQQRMCYAILSEGVLKFIYSLTLI